MENEWTKFYDNNDSFEKLGFEKTIFIQSNIKTATKYLKEMFNIPLNGIACEEPQTDGKGTIINREILKESIGDDLITKDEALEELNDSFCPPTETKSFREYNTKLVDMIFGELAEMGRYRYDDLYEEKVNLK